MIMNKVAFICPLYDMKNHFDLAFNLYKSKHDLHIEEEIYFVFSDEAQKEKFRNRIYEAFSEEISWLILPEDQLDYKSKVTVKKFYGLKTLKDKYDYLAAIDSETLFIKKVDFPKLFEEIWDKRLCLNSNISPDGFQFMRRCFRTVNLYYYRKLRCELRGFLYNFWFNEIPVYKCDNLTEFFVWLDKFDKEKWMNEYLCFEYYLYAAFLIIEKGFHINRFNICSNGGVIEYIIERPPHKQLHILNRLGTHWTSCPDVTNDNIVMLFHLDRGNRDGYGFHLKTKSIFKFLSYKWLGRLVIDFVNDKILCKQRD